MSGTCVQGSAIFANHGARQLSEPALRRCACARLLLWLRWAAMSRQQSTLGVLAELWVRVGRAELAAQDSEVRIPSLRLAPVVSRAAMELSTTHSDIPVTNPVMIATSLAVTGAVPIARSKRVGSVSSLANLARSSVETATCRPARCAMTLMSSITTAVPATASQSRLVGVAPNQVNGACSTLALIRALTPAKTAMLVPPRSPSVATAL